MTVAFDVYLDRAKILELTHTVKYKSIHRKYLQQFASETVSNLCFFAGFVNLHPELFPFVRDRVNLPVFSSRWRCLG